MIKEYKEYEVVCNECGETLYLEGTSSANVRGKACEAYEWGYTLEDDYIFDYCKGCNKKDRPCK